MLRALLIHLGLVKAPAPEAQPVEPPCPPAVLYRWQHGCPHVARTSDAWGVKAIVERNDVYVRGQTIESVAERYLADVWGGR